MNQYSWRGWGKLWCLMSWAGSTWRLKVSQWPRKNPSQHILQSWRLIISFGESFQVTTHTWGPLLLNRESPELLQAETDSHFVTLLQGIEREWPHLHKEEWHNNIISMCHHIWECILFNMEVNIINFAQHLFIDSFTKRNKMNVWLQYSSAFVYCTLLKFYSLIQAMKAKS